MRATRVRIRNMPTVPNPPVWTAYDRDLLRSLRIQTPHDDPVIQDPELFYTALVLLVPGLVVLALWITYLVQMWD